MTDESLVAAEILNPNWLTEYEQQRDALATQLRELNTMMFMLEKIEEFPFWLFTPDTRDWIFWRTTRFSFIETTLMIASRIIVDKDKEALTLRGFKGEILRQAINDTAREAITVALKKVDFEKRIDSIERKLRQIRNNFLAHHNRHQHTLLPDNRTIPDITYGEMKELLTAAYDLFNVLSFEVFFVPWFVELNDQLRDMRRTGIDNLLELVAKNSVLLNLPEKNPSAWERRRSSLTVTDLEKLNEYRRKSGLSEVS